MIRSVKTIPVDSKTIPPFSAKKTKEGWQVDILWGVPKKDFKKFERQAKKCGCTVMPINPKGAQ